MEADRPSSARTFRALALLAPMALAVAGYARTLRGEFQLDDLSGIAGSWAVKAPAAWLRESPVLGLLVAGRPLTTLSFALDHALGRLDPFGYHAVNVALHLVVVLLVAALADRVAALAGAERPRLIALGVAGLFAVHPLQTQAVSYVSQRAEVLASALYVATLLLLLAAAARPRGRGRLHAAAGCAAFALGLAAKPVLVTAPVAYLVLRLAAAPRAPDAGGGGGWRRTAALLAPISLAAGAFGAALVLAQRGRADAGFSVAGTTPWIYFLTELRAVAIYLRLLAWPAGQTVEWDLAPSPGLADPATLVAALALATLVAVAGALVRFGRRRPGADGAAARLAGAGVVWFLVILSPTSTFVPLADAMAEHRVYLASWGIFLAAVSVADALAARARRPRVAVGCWAAAVLALSLALHGRNAVWETEEALWADAAAKAPRSARAHTKLGDALAAAGRTEDAVREYERALRHTGANVAQRAKVLVALGDTQRSAGQIEDARRSYGEALHFLPRDPGALAAAALAAGASGDAAGAESLARRALEIEPRQPIAWTVLGHLALERGEPGEALAAYDRAVALDPDRGDAQFGRALALRALGRGGEECAALGAALGAGLAPEYRDGAAARLAAGCR